MAGIDSNTKLMLHMNGTDGSTTFTDSSDSAHTITAIGNAQIDTAKSKFGGASGLFDGTGDYLTVPDSNDWNFGSGDFTIDCWIRINVVKNEVVFSHTVTGAANCKMKLLISANLLRFVVFDLSDNIIVNFTNDFIPSVNVWYHLAVVRNGSTWTIYIDGVGGTPATSSETLPDYTDNFIIGSMLESGSSLNDFDGWIEEFRISNVARWTVNFTPPSSEYSVSVETFSASIIM